MLLIRALEEALRVHPECGFQLFSSGQEAVAVGVCAALERQDALLCGGRSIGFAVARGLGLEQLVAEFLGRSSGVCGGLAGRGHLTVVSEGLFGAHSVVAGNISVAAGAALAAQMRRTGAIAVCVFGDGACGSGQLFETMNIAALWRLPVLFVCDNNQYASSMPVERHTHAKPLTEVARPFMGVAAADGMSVVDVAARTEALAAGVRQGHGPAFLECRSYRFSKHSTRSRETRPADEVARWRERCPIAGYRALLSRRGILGHAEASELEGRVRARVTAAMAAAEADSRPSPTALGMGVEAR